MKIKAFIQARMSSKRFPGKVLAPLNGKPIILHVIERVAKAISLDDIVVLTSLELSDEPVVAFLKTRKINCFQGDLNNVLDRFNAALNQYPCDWVVRICGDSPEMDPDIITTLIEKIDNQYDIITNVFPRSFPKGHSVEIIKTESLKKVANKDLLPEEREHVTQHFYNQHQHYQILNILNEKPYQQDNYAIDILEDYYRLQH